MTARGVPQGFAVRAMKALACEVYKDFNVRKSRHVLVFASSFGF